MEVLFFLIPLYSLPQIFGLPSSFQIHYTFLAIVLLLHAMHDSLSAMHDSLIQDFLSLASDLHIASLFAKDNCLTYSSYRQCYCFFYLFLHWESLKCILRFFDIRFFDKDSFLTDSFINNKIKTYISDIP